MNIPADVPKKYHETYEKNYNALTRGKDRLMLFACDQKLEHLNEDFYGVGISSEDNDPRHLFELASKGDIGAFATHLGLVSLYGKEYPDVNYIVKLNGKSNLVKTEQRDPMSMQLWLVEQVMQFAYTSDLNIPAIGYTLYLGSEFESQMLTQAAQVVYNAHQFGMLAVLWIYPRGSVVKNEKNGQLISGAAGVGASLGADFVKINMPEGDEKHTALEWLSVATEAAGKTKVIVAGGSKKDDKEFLRNLEDQLKIGKTAGSATGRNLHQRDLNEAVALSKKISKLIYGNN